jgi:hypothetical protein
MLHIAILLCNFKTECHAQYRCGNGCLFVVSVVRCQVVVSASGRSLVQRSHTECGVSKGDREASIVRKPWPTRGCCAMVGDLLREILSSCDLAVVSAGRAYFETTLVYVVFQGLSYSYRQEETKSNNLSRTYVN